MNTINWVILHGSIRHASRHPDCGDFLIDHLVHEQLGNLPGHPNRLDHENRLLHHDRDVDDLVDELKLRKILSFQHPEPKSTCHCTPTGMSATLSTQEREEFHNELQLCDLDCLLTACTRETCWTCTRGTSITVSTSNWGISMVF